MRYNWVKEEVICNDDAYRLDDDEEYEEEEDDDNDDGENEL